MRSFKNPLRRATRTTSEWSAASWTISSAGSPNASRTSGLVATTIQGGSFDSIAWSICRVPSKPIGPPVMGVSKTWSTVSLAPRPAATRAASLTPSQDAASAMTGARTDAKVRTVSRTTSTGTSARRTTVSATEPRRTRSRPVLPRVPITIRSAPRRLAHATISRSGSPVSGTTGARSPTRPRSSSSATSPDFAIASASRPGPASPGGMAAASHGRT